MRILTLAALAVALGASQSHAKGLSSGDARDALELHYIKKIKHYYPPTCDVETVQKRRFVFCTAGGGDGTIGGLYLVDEDRPAVYAVNGKAIQHIGSAKSGTIETVDTRPVAVSRWKGEMLPIPEILKAFR